MRQTASRRRGGFTLVELLTVISIIGILVSLLLYAILGASSKGVDLQCTNDIRQISSALDQFKQKYGVYPPSRITLCGDLNVMGSVDPFGLAFIKTVWPRIQPKGINWAGIPGGGVAAGNTQFPLEGDQCLVYFLSGIPSQDIPGTYGFSSNPFDPTDLSSGTKESIFQFDVSRLFARPTSKMYQTYGEKIKFYSFKDPYSTDQPYVYFSAGRSSYLDPRNSTQVSNDNPVLMPVGLTPTSGPYFEGDAASFMVQPPVRRFLNKDRFQIISAGRDGKFGPGGPWSPATAMSLPPDAKDDMSNFYDAKLGVPQ